MSIVMLVSGGLDSTLMSLMAQEESINVHPLFIDYGQLNVEKEWEACCALHDKYNLPQPIRMDLSGFGKLISCGITNRAMRINEDAFLPGRNLLLILAGASYAYYLGVESVAIGLLNEEHRLFPDQTKDFLKQCESMIETSLGRHIYVIAPLINLSKSEVLQMAQARKVVGTYSCHAGGDTPCGKCVSCIEIKNSQERK
jgi:7-cyano-7-deazaguanine synthase